VFGDQFFHLEMVFLSRLSATRKYPDRDMRIGNEKSASLQRLVGHCWRVSRYLSGETSHKRTCPEIVSDDSGMRGRSFMGREIAHLDGVPGNTFLYGRKAMSRLSLAKIIAVTMLQRRS